MEGVIFYKSRELRNFVIRNHFSHTMSGSAAPMCNYTFTDIPETVSEVKQFYATFVECITACANTVVPKYKFNPHSKPF